MLKFLSIENFALIERLEVEFRDGLNLITGETGSGKSILVDAVGLLVGERASQEMVRQGLERARVEGLFELPSEHPAWSHLAQLDIPREGNQLIIRREIALSGNNKVFVNGVLSTQGWLAELGMGLGDIHGQHAQQQLLHPGIQLAFLDAFGGHQRLVEKVGKAFGRLQEVRNELSRLQAGEQDRLQRLDTLGYQIGEIEGLRLKPGLDRELEEERGLLASAEKRLEAAEHTYQLLYEQEASVLAQLRAAEQNLAELAKLDRPFGETTAEMSDLRYQLEEIAFQVRDYASGIAFDPERLELLEARLADIQKARRKYGETVEDMLAYLEKARAEARTLDEGDERIRELSSSEPTLAEAYAELAGQLSRKRRDASRRLAKQVEKELADLNMDQTVFIIEVRADAEQATEKGIDEVEFLISPNPGEAPRPLARIASGGELSRTVLALRSILTLEDYPKTVVFDEVDAGIGGRVASRIGEKLARLGDQHQVFCVTHLPQIASFARQHFHVDKRRRGKRTVIEIEALGEETRVQEIARMMAGNQVTGTTRRQAEEMLEMAHRGGTKQRKEKKKETRA